MKNTLKGMYLEADNIGLSLRNYEDYLLIGGGGHRSGNDDEATNSTERKASPRQIEVLSKNYTGENLEKLLKMNKIEKLEDMPMSKASELIGKIMKQRKADNHE